MDDKASKGFQPGHNKPGPGRPTIPEEIKEARRLNKDLVEITINKFLHMSLEELIKFSTDKSNQVHEMLVARIMAQAIKTGDNTRLEWIYQRLFGKIPDKIVHDVSTPYQVAMGFLKERKKELIEYHREEHNEEIIIDVSK